MMKLVVSPFLLSSAILLFYVFGIEETFAGSTATEHRGLLFGGEGGLLGFIIALFSIFTSTGRRRFFSCQLGFNLCLCNFEDFRGAVEENRDASICFSTTLLVDEAIDVTNKSFRIGCDGEPCGLRPVGLNFGSLFVGSPQDAIFDTVSLSTASAEDGGAMKLTGGKTSCINCEFFGNSASQNGGAIHISAGELILDSPTFSDNVAAGSGGAIYVTGGATVSIIGESDQDDTMFDHFFNFNSADQGGAIAVDNGSVAIEDTDFFCGNTADSLGNNIFVGSGAMVTCENVMFEADRGLAGDASPTCEASAIMGDGSATFCTT